MTGEHLDWDNLRYFLAVARAGKLTAAARGLGQDHTTVGRRIASLESAFRSKLFERRPEGYRLTETGQRLYENVKTLESSVREIQRDLAGQTQQVEGEVRIGAPDDFGNLFRAKHVGELQSLHHRPKGDRGARAFRSFPHSFEPIQNPIASRPARSRGSYGRGGSSA
jgi:DNA-binding transcriptional LysR family regulator